MRDHSKIIPRSKSKGDCGRVTHSVARTRGEGGPSFRMSRTSFGLFCQCIDVGQTMQQFWTCLDLYSKKQAKQETKLFHEVANKTLPRSIWIDASACFWRTGAVSHYCNGGVSTMSITTRTVVRECCKDDCESLWKSLKFDPSPRKYGLTDRPPNLHRWLCPRYPSQCKLLCRSDQGFFLPIWVKYNSPKMFVFTCVSYAEARNSYRLDICPSVRHTLAPYQNGWIYCHAFFTTR